MSEVAGMQARNRQGVLLDLSTLGLFRGRWAFCFSFGRWIHRSGMCRSEIVSWMHGQSRDNQRLVWSIRIVKRDFLNLDVICFEVNGS